VSRKPAIGIFIVRAWYEDDQFRARVTKCLDVDTEPVGTLAVADLDELRSIFNAWLTATARPSPSRREGD
jgi:hypothetical protein